MYGSRFEVLKTSGNIQLSMSIQHKHVILSSGRGSIKTEIRYHVEYKHEYQVETENYSGAYSLTCKSEAKRIFNQVVKHGMGSLVQAVSNE